MPKSILSAENVQKEGDNFVEVKIGKLPWFAKAVFAYAMAAVWIFASVFLYKFAPFASVPLFFKMVIPVMLFLMSLIIFASARQLQYYSLLLKKQGNNLYIKKIFSKRKFSEKTISLAPDAKLVLVKFPISIFYYQLLLANSGQLEPLIPVEWDVVRKFPIIHPVMKKFLYTPESAKELSRLIEIPLEEPEKNFHKYISELKIQQPTA